MRLGKKSNAMGIKEAGGGEARGWRHGLDDRMWSKQDTQPFFRLGVPGKKKEPLLES